MGRGLKSSRGVLQGKLLRRDAGLKYNIKTWICSSLKGYGIGQATCMIVSESQNLKIYEGTLTLKINYQEKNKGKNVKRATFLVGVSL